MSNLMILYVTDTYVKTSLVDGNKRLHRKKTKNVKMSIDPMYRQVISTQPATYTADICRSVFFFVFSTSDSKNADVLLLSKVRFSWERMRERMRESCHWLSQHLSHDLAHPLSHLLSRIPSLALNLAHLIGSDRSHDLNPLLRIRSRIRSRASALVHPLPFVMWSVWAYQIC